MAIFKASEIPVHEGDKNIFLSLESCRVVSLEQYLKELREDLVSEQHIDQIRTAPIGAEISEFDIRIVIGIADEIARTFCDLVRMRFSMNEMHSVLIDIIRKDAGIPLDQPSSIHDYLDDANDLMDEAFLAITEREFESTEVGSDNDNGGDQDDSSLFSEAWRIARENKFFTSI